MKILAIDTGFSSCKVYYVNEQGIPQFDKYASIIGKLENVVEVNDENMFFFNGAPYYLFETALRLPNKQILDMSSYEGLREAAPVFLSYLLKKYGSGFDKIVIGLSLAMVEKAEDFLDYVSSQLMMDRDKFMLLPQGTSSKACITTYGLDPRDSTRRNDVQSRAYLACNIGSNTADFFTVINNTTSSQATRGFENAGLVQVAFNLIDKIRKDTGKEINLQKAKTIVDTGIYTSRGRSVDYSATIKTLTLEYFTRFFDLIEQNFGEQLETMDNLFICGGGAVLLRKYLHELTPMIEKHFPVDYLLLPNDLAEFYDVVGYSIIAEKLLNRK